MKSNRFEVVVFDSEDDSRAETMASDLSWPEALELAELTFASGKCYGVEIIDLDPDNMEPIVWIKTQTA